MRIATKASSPLRSNRAAHSDARGAAFYFIERYWPRAGGCER